LFNLEPGKVLGQQYQIIRKLGEGAMGYVLLANDLALDRFVAIKVLRPAIATLFETNARIRREARLLSRLNHPNVVVLYSFGSESPDLHYIVMEYVTGETLEKRLEGRGQLDPLLVWHIMSQMGSAVADAHQHSIIHRDLKPANVLLTARAGDSNHVKVVDFGVAKALQPDGASTSSSGLTGWVGTPAYMAPDVEPHSTADIYALGTIACELLTGRRPFDESGSMGDILLRKMNGEHTVPSRLRPDLDWIRGTQLDAVISKAIACKPEDRYQSVEQFLLDLYMELPQVARARPPSSLPPGPFPSDPPPSVSRPPPLPVIQPRPPSPAMTTTIDAQAPQPAPAAGAGAGAPEIIRDATVLYLDLMGAVAAGSIDMDEYLDCLGVVGARLRQVLEQHRGVELGPLADQLVVLFRSDGVSENDAERALDAALAVRSTLAALSRDPTIPASFQLEFRIGIDTGRLASSAAGDGVAVVHGAPLFEARRLARAALAGQVRISNGVFRRVRGLYEWGVPGDPHGDGTGRVVRAKRSVAYLKPAEIHGVRVSLVGRERELGVVRAALRRAVEEKSPRVLAVTGPEGVGKSRLAAEFIKEIEDRRGETYYLEMGRCTPGWQGVPYEPFIQAIRHRARLLDDDPPEKARMKIEHYIRRFLVDDPTRFGEDEQRLCRELAALLGVPDEEERRRARGDGGGDEARRKQMFDAVASVYRRVSARYPILFVLDDFEHATAPTKALLAHVVASLSGCKALFLVLLRAETPESVFTASLLRSRPVFEALHVGPLGREAGEALAKHMLRALVEVPMWLVRRIGDLAEGVPLIIEEIVHDLIDNGVIAVEEHGWRMAGPPGVSVRLPAGLAQIYLRRFERLELRLREAVEAAAVAGRRFWPSLLRKMLGGRLDAPVLADLTRRGIFVERRDVILQGESDHAFAQAAMQEVVYQSVPPARRRDLHKAAAVWLERVMRGAGAMREDNTIGHHFREAGDLKRALPYELRAAEHAMRVHAIEEAVRLLESCRETLQQLAAADPGSRELQRQLAEVMASLVHQLVLAGDPERAVALAEETLAGLDASHPETAREAARIAIGRGAGLELLGRHVTARDAFMAATRLLGGDTSLLALMALAGEVSAAVHLGEQDGSAARLRRLVEAHGAAPASQEWERALSAAHRALGKRELELGHHEASEAELMRAYDLALSAIAPVEAVAALDSLAALHQGRGDLERAAATWRAALEQAERADLAWYRSVILVHLGELELSRGEAARAREALQHALALHQQLRSERGLAEAHRALAECYLALGELDLAWAQAQRSLDHALRARSPLALGEAHRAAAQVLHGMALRGARPGALAEVTHHLDASLSAFEAVGQRRWIERTKALRAELLG